VTDRDLRLAWRRGLLAQELASHATRGANELVAAAVARCRSAAVTKADRAALKALLAELATARLSTWSEDDPPVDVCIRDSQRVAVVKALQRVLNKSWRTRCYRTSQKAP